MKTGLIISLSVMLFSLSVAGCTADNNFNAQLDSIAKPYRFSILRWEIDNLLAPREPADSGESLEGESRRNPVAGYFSLLDRIKTLEAELLAIPAGSRAGDRAAIGKKIAEIQRQEPALAEATEKIIGHQIKDILTARGIYHPFQKYIAPETGFPPLNFKLDKPPHLLVVSPRHRIESIREVILRPDIRLEDMDHIEARVDETGTSSLVIELGGFGGTYPTFVTNRADLSFTVDTATEEWLHQYLAFKPLGFLYLLDVTGLARNYDIAVMNETLAGIVSKEIGSAVYETYYAVDEQDEASVDTAAPEFDFNREMREIRRAVDNYLAQGEIEAAEEFMEQKRQFLAAKGYYIRKLNQAYFAFHGTYADEPTSISPIGIEMKALREQSASLEEFLETVAVMTSRQDLSLSLQ